MSGMARGGAEALIDRRYEVIAAARRPELDSPGAEAHEVRDRALPDRELFALVCGEGALPRLDVLESLSRVDLDGFLCPLAWGVIPWSGRAGRRHAVVFEQPIGARLTAAEATAFEPVKPEQVINLVVRPLLPVLREMADRGLTHRAIRADNLFKAADSGTFTLGEAVSGLPGRHQPAIYETIELGMAEPTARGPGTPGCDLYAFGVVLVELLTGKRPWIGKSAAEVVAAKLERSSAGLFLDRSIAGLNFTELLRGLLCDDPRERWTVEDIDQWLNGRQMTPKQAILPAKATRPYRFDGVEYWNTRSLAHAMTGSWSRAARSLTTEGKVLADWLQRSLDLESHAEMVTQALRGIGRSEGSETSAEDRALALVLIALDPAAPLRYRDVSISPTGIGQALAINFHRSDWLASFVELMHARLPSVWSEMQQTNKAEYYLQRCGTEAAGKLLIQDRQGFGREQALYMLNSDWPCQSPMVAEDFVLQAGELLPALERRAQRGDRPKLPVDGHVAAFLAARLSGFNEKLLFELDHQDEARKHLAMLRLLAEAQRLTKPQALPGLASWFAALLAPVVETFHNRPYRRDLAAASERAAERGSLAELYLLFANDRSRAADDQGYRRALATHRNASREIAWLEAGGLTGPANVGRVSRQVASAVSAVLSALALVGLSVYHVL